MTTEIRRALAAVLVARTAANGGLRVVYPFLPAIARGLGAFIPALSGVVALRNLGGLFTPVTARLAESLGRRRLMAIAMTSVALGCLLTASTSRFWVAGVGIVLVGVAKPAFDVAMQAWFGDRVPYSDRGRVFGITELTWPLGLIVTVPISGFLIEATSWRAPFVLVGLFAAGGTLATLSGIDSDVPHRREPRPLRLTPPRARMLVAILLFSVAAEIPLVVYGQWLEEVFGLTVAGIGVFTIIVVLAELVGEGLVVVISDRVGLKRMILLGLAVSGLAYASLSITDGSLLVATVVIVAWITAFEVTIVAAIPFTSELATVSRDRLLSLVAVAIAVGRAIGAAGAQSLYSAGGIGRTGIVSALCTVAAAALMLTLSEPRPSADDGSQRKPPN